MALQDAIDQGADKGRSVNRTMPSLSNTVRELIQVLNLALEQHDGHLCPGFGMELGAPRSSYGAFGSCAAGRTPFHGPEILAALVPAQTHPFSLPYAEKSTE
jgi:hypothetical protein